MTTIAVSRSERSMASDSRITVSSGAVTNLKQKIFKVPMGLVGIAGGASAALIFVDALNKMADGAEIGAVINDADESFEALLLRNDGRLIFIEGGGAPLELTASFFSIGSGSHLALGAMSHGASVKDAVKTAMRYDPYTGGPVRVMRLS